MQFKRYGVVIKDAIICLSFPLIVVALMGLVLYALAGWVIVMAVTWFAVSDLAETNGGTLNDYVVITDDQVELHCKGKGKDKGKDKTVVIQWDDVIAYKRFRPIRGVMLKAIIVDKYGAKISYATSYKRDKKIFAIRPELKDLLIDSPEWEK